MCSSRRMIPLGFTQECLEEGSHICHIYHDEQERMQTITRYLGSGLKARERVICLTSISQEKLLDLLQSSGIDTSSIGSAMVFNDMQAGYRPSGRFNIDQMLGLIREFYQQALETGFTGARGTGEMTWSLSGGSEDLKKLMIYEARINDLLSQYPCTICCQYDTSKFNGQTIMDVLSVHPVCIVRGQMFKNPFYIQPEKFIQELIHRT